MEYRWKRMDSPVGELRLVAVHDQLAAVLWRTELPGRVVLGDELTEVPRDRTLAEAERQLREYFEGRREAFDLDLRFEGTPFQRRVWQALLAIPYGETLTYGQVAARIGSPGAARAVGAANGRNPIAIVIPCHRLLGASGGGLRGFAGGLEAKETLLSLESESFRTRRLGRRRVFVPASGYTPASWVSR